jgi:uncharacterized protein (TIGR02996 family)
MIPPGFLSTILDNPDDDTPRLVCADWLDEQGENARAEFIRVQCELARLEAEKAGSTVPAYVESLIEAADLRRRERELLPKVIGRECLRWADLGWTFEQWEWRRGFIEALTLTPAALTHLDAIRAEQPVRRVRLAAWPADTDFMAGLHPCGESGYRHARWAGIVIEPPAGRLALPYF